MKTQIKSIAIFFILIFFISIASPLLEVRAWGDNSDGRPSYTIEEVNNGAIGATKDSDGENYKNSSNYPGIIVFNSISDSVIGDEKDFVGARECVFLNDGSIESANRDTIWNSREIEVEDGKTYFVRLYVHNNNPNGFDAIAENTKIWFNVPSETATQIEVTGFIDSPNASPTRYWDDVIFKSIDGAPFHLDYIYGSAVWENNKIGLGGIQLDDNIVQAKSAAEGKDDGGVLIGYDALDGKMPGGYEYDGGVTIQVKAVFDYDFTIETKVRLADNEDKTWQDSVEAKIGDKVEFQLHYRNTGSTWQEQVRIHDTLPSHLRYVEGSTRLMNANHPNGDKVNDDGDNTIVANGFKIGSYSPDANAYILFAAEVIDEGLAEGANTLVNWAQVGVGDKVIQDYATVEVYKTPESHTIISILCVIIVFCVIIIIFLTYKIAQKRRKLGLPKHKWRNKK